MRTISTPVTSRAVIDATISPRASFSFTGLRTMSHAAGLMPAVLLGRHDKRYGPLLLQQVHLVQGGPKPLRELQRIVIRPEMHVEHPRLVVQHVAVQGRHLDTVV